LAKSSCTRGAVESDAADILAVVGGDLGQTLHSIRASRGAAGLGRAAGFSSDIPGAQSVVRRGPALRRDCTVAATAAPLSMSTQF